MKRIRDLMAVLCVAGLLWGVAVLTVGCATGPQDSAAGNPGGETQQRPRSSG